MCLFNLLFTNYSVNYIIFRIEVTFLRKNGDRIKGRGKEGDSLLDVVVNCNLDIDGFGKNIHI
jgi:hypothetical protein